MKIHRATFIITLVCGILILLMGIYLQISGHYSKGYTTARYSRAYEGVINGYSGIFLGIVVLLLSIYAFKTYKKEKEKFRKLR
jgi:hypothetical protein